jgi:Na+/melibiose symporter-like transporter
MVFVVWIVFSLLVGMVGKEKNIGFGWAFFWSLLLSPLIGLIITLTSSKKRVKSHAYKSHLEIAKRFEYKNNREAAIESYMDALYHLENDYKQISKPNSIKRDKIISETKDRIEYLKGY